MATPKVAVEEEEVKKAASVLNEDLQARLRAIVETDLSHAIIREDLSVVELSGFQRWWKRLLGRTSRAELIEVARKLQNISNLEKLSDEQKGLVDKAKKRIRSLVSRWTQRVDLSRTVLAQFDGVQEAERIELKNWSHAQGLLVASTGAAMNQVENTPPHHPNAGLNMDHGRLCYYDDGSCTLVVTEGAREGGLGNVYCSQEVSEALLRQSADIVSPGDFDSDRVHHILQSTSQEICEGYQEERRENDSGSICMGKAAFILAKTFASEYPGRVETKCVAIGYSALFFRHNQTGQIFQLTRAEKPKEEEEGFRDSTTRFFNPQASTDSYWDWMHFSDALVPTDGCFLALTSRVLDNVYDTQALEAVVCSPVFDEEIPGPTPWPSLPNMRQIRRYTEASGQSLENPKEVSPEEMCVRLQHYCSLMSRNNLAMNEEIFDLVEARKQLHAQWKRLVDEGKLSPSQLHELTLGETVITSEGNHLDGRQLLELEAEVDKLLEDLESVPGRAGDFLVAAAPVYQSSNQQEASLWQQLMWALFGSQ